MGGTCQHPGKHVYKVKIYIPGSKKYKSAILDTRDEATASEMALNMYNNFKKEIFPDKRPNLSLFDAILKFLDFKKNPPKNQPPVSSSTLTDYSLHLGRFAEGLQASKLDLKLLGPADMGNHIAEILFKHLSGKFGKRTVEKHFSTYENFCNFLIEEEGVKIVNPFSGWYFGVEEGENRTITANQFHGLLQAIDQRPARNDKGEFVKQPWLKDAFKLALYSGARRQEVPIIRWSAVLPNENNRLEGGFLLLEDMKVSAIKKLNEVKTKPIEINDDLAELLYEMGWEKMKESENYIIDPQETCSRQYIKDMLSRAFTHYISFVDPGLKFGCLRKTWFTSCAIAIGVKNASKMGGHSSESVTLAHYINRLEAAGSRGKFRRIFSLHHPPPNNG